MLSTFANTYVNNNEYSKQTSLSYLLHIGS